MENLKITKGVKYMGIYFFESNKGSFNVEFFYNSLVIRKASGKLEIILKINRNLNGTKRLHENIENYFNNEI